MREYKVGDRVRIKNGVFYGEIAKVDGFFNGGLTFWYTDRDGCEYHCTAKLNEVEPLDKRTPKRGDWVLVSDDGEKWEKRRYMQDGYGGTIRCLDGGGCWWKYMKPLEEEPIKITMTIENDKSERKEPIEENIKCILCGSDGVLMFHIQGKKICNHCILYGQSNQEQPIPCPTCGTELKEEEKLPFTYKVEDGKIIITDISMPLEIIPVEGKTMTLTSSDYDLTKVEEEVEEDDKYEKCAEVHKPPRRFRRLGKIYAEMLHDIDWDVSGDETIPKKYREKRFRKIKTLLITGK